MDFRTYLETNGKLEASVQEVSNAQMAWELCHDLLPSFNNDMNLTIAEYVKHMAESEDLEQLGKELGILLIHAPHYNKKSASVDRDKIFAYIKRLMPNAAEMIIQSTLKAYSMYEMRPFTVNTIKRLG